MRRSLCGPFQFGCGKSEMVPDFFRFSGDDANEPAPDKAQWILEHLLRFGAIPDRTAVRTLASGAVFRTDIYQKARQLAGSGKSSEPAEALELATA